jgi:uncharacterized protein (DUF849 family)
VDRARQAGAIERQQVRQVRLILEGLGLEVATPAEAREILQLKGVAKVAF